MLKKLQIDVTSVQARYTSFLNLLFFERTPDVSKHDLASTKELENVLQTDNENIFTFQKLTLFLLIVFKWDSHFQLYYISIRKNIFK